MAFKSLSIVAVAVLALSAGVAQAQNRFVNGGFEDAQATILGNPTVIAPDATKAQGWIPGGLHGYNRSADARTGSFSALVAQLTPDSNAVVLQNSKATGGLPNLVVGESLTLSFWAKSQVTEALGFYNFSYALRFLNDNGNILAQSAIVNFATQTNNTTWSLITAAPLVVPVGATSAFVEFSAAAGGRLAAYRIDDVALVPEPGTYALMLAGLACVGGIAARRRRAA